VAQHSVTKFITIIDINLSGFDEQLSQTLVAQHSVIKFITIIVINLNGFDEHLSLT
jgi:hypothetical protein